MGKHKNLLVDIKNSICTVKINRPDVLNALDEKTYKEIYDFFTDIKENDDVDVIVITGEGRSFIAGADIGYMRSLDSKQGKAFGELGKKAFSAIENIDKVVIACINGFALGGGCELSLACDIRIASQKAKFGQPEVTLGITPGSGGTQRLSRIVGIAKAKELIFTGKTIGADEALSIGLVNMLTKHEDLLDETYKMAQMIARNGKYALRYSKEAINKGSQVDIDTGLSIESSLFGLCFGTEEQKEGMNAFIEKREPVFNRK